MEITLLPISRMWERVEIARQDSDTSLFWQLMSFGEMITKVVCSGLVAAIEEDRDRSRYRQLHRLVRADGIGEWASVLDEVVAGPTSQFLLPAVDDEKRSLTSKVTRGSWQYDACELLHRCVSLSDPSFETISPKTEGRRWFQLFAVLRNKTRGHGAPTAELCGQISPFLERSISTFLDNFNLFQREWAYLHRNLSGKYRVTRLTKTCDRLDKYKSQQASLMDGVYVFFDRPVRVELMHTSVEALDFFFPNGAFNEKTFEILSYITNAKANSDAAPYLAPATALPISETQGLENLGTQGLVFANVPPKQDGYIRRKALENELLTSLRNE